MAAYLLIESHSPFESADVSYYYSLAQELVEKGNDVTLFLVQEGVLAARKSARDVGIKALAENVRVLADDFSLAERSIAAEALVPGVTASDIDAVVDMVAAGVKAVWH